MEHWRQICSLAFADDWLGAMCNVTEVHKVWTLWNNWEDITGSKLGIKARGKPVLTGIVYGTGGRPYEVKDPELFTAYRRGCPSCRITPRTSTSGSISVRMPSTT